MEVNIKFFRAYVSFSRIKLNKDFCNDYKWFDLSMATFLSLNGKKKIVFNSWKKKETATNSNLTFEQVNSFEWSDFFFRSNEQIIMLHGNLSFLSKCPG